MCVVGQECEHGWKEPLPQGCPPEKARNTNGETYYRLLENNPPAADDFKSYAELKKPTMAPECEARSISLVTELAAAHAKLLPRTRFVGIGLITLAPGSGAIFVRKTHVHWWPCGACDPLGHCVVVG